MKSQVAIVKCRTYNQEILFTKVKEALSVLGGVSLLIRPGTKVLLKPNLLMAVRPEQGITTHPEFVRSVIRILKEVGCKIYLGDGPSVFGRQTEDVLKVYEATGMKRVADEEKIELVVFDKRFMQRDFPLASWVRECDYIVNLPKFKTHEFMVLTGAVKNVFGLVPGTFKMEIHKNFSEPEKFADVLLDIYQAVKPAVSIVDAVVGLEGNGPGTSGKIRELGFILASQDGVALDCVLAGLMNINPDHIFTNRQARKRKIGNTDLGDIEIKGEAISSCGISNFKLPESSLRNKLPNSIMSFLRKLIYFRPRIDSDICRLCESCIENCPQKTISNKDSKIIIDYKECISCFCCSEVCPHAAIKVKKSFLARLLNF